MYVITGATGNTGKEIAEALLAADKKVRVIGRSADKLKSLAGKGAEAAVGSLDDAAFVTKAFTGATAVYAMIPPDLQTPDMRAYQNRIGETITNAVRGAGVKHIVALSSVGAHLPKDAGVVQGLYDFEQMLNKLDGTNVLHLRPTYFMENLFWQIGTVKQMNIFGSPIKGDTRFPIVATKDIAVIATKRLVKLDFSGKSVQYILGARDVTYNELAQVLGKAIGKEAPYVQFPYDDARNAMIGMGMSAGVADAFIEFQKSMNDGKITSDAKRDVNSTTTTTIEEFAQIWAGAYRAQ